MGSWLPFIAAAIVSSGCGLSAQQAASSAFQGLEFKALDGEGLKFDGNSIAGTGTLIFRMPRPEDDSNFGLSFALEPEGALNLVTNSNRTLSTGVSLTFKRLPSDTLGVVLAVGEESFDVSEDFRNISAAKPVTVSVDVHGHGHTILWIGNQEFQYAFTTRVSGKLWGLKFQKANLTSVSASKAKQEGR